MTFIDLPVLEPISAMKAPTSLVVRYGFLRFIGEFPFDGDVRPGCGTKVIIRTRRGTEIAEVLTTSCSSSGCAKSITREKMLAYIENSGGQDFPFSTEGKVLRILTPDDLKRQAASEVRKPEYTAACKTLISEMDLPMKLVNVETILGDEMVTFYFLAEHRVDFRALVKHLASRFHTRIQLHQVGARDEARLVADFETCGEHCCCRQFLKVLKPISMGAAKMQKATLDPSKISGRCGRLKCCLRYEEENYEELKKKLPRGGTIVRTKEGVGRVIDTTILTQLVKVLIGEERVVAVANDELLERDLPQSALQEAPPPPSFETGNSDDSARLENRDRRDRREPRPARPPRETREPQPNADARPPRPEREDRGRPQPRGDRSREDRPREDRPREDRPREQRSQRPQPPSQPQRQQPQPQRQQSASPPGPAPQAQQSTPVAPPPQPGVEQPPRPPGVGMMGRRRRGRGRGRGLSEPPQTGSSPAGNPPDDSPAGE